MITQLERRQLSDRRGQPTSLLSTLRLRGERKEGRRTGEGRWIYVDALAPRIAGLALFILISSFLDALLTLLHVQRGGQEANPLMALALRQGDGVFVAAKMAATGCGVWLLAAHQHFPRVRTILHSLAGGYALLLIYHIILILRSRA